MNKHLINLIEGVDTRNVYTRIKEKLEQGMKENRLIYTQNLRGIGKTKALIEFAKENNLVVIEPHNEIARLLIKEYGYKNIVNNNVNMIQGKNIKQTVIDEGVYNIEELRNIGINICTGFTNYKDIFTYNKKENNIEIYSDEDVISKLNLEITKLCKMLDVHTNFDQYKMIINNLRNTIEARRDIIKYPNVEDEEENIEQLQNRLKNNIINLTKDIYINNIDINDTKQIELRNLIGKYINSFYDEKCLVNDMWLEKIKFNIFNIIAENIIFDKICSNYKNIGVDIEICTKDSKCRKIETNYKNCIRILNGNRYINKDMNVTPISYSIKTNELESIINSYLLNNYSNDKNIRNVIDYYVKLIEDKINNELDLLLKREEYNTGEFKIVIFKNMYMETKESIEIPIYIAYFDNIEE